MSPSEIIYMRLGRFVRDNIFKSNPVVPDALSFFLIPFEDETRYYYLAHFGKMKGDVVAEAEKILENRIILFKKESLFENIIDWNVDFISGRRWPLSGPDYRFSKDSDPKYVWELNRHQFLPTLGKAFFLTGDERYARKVFSLIGSWINGNPLFQGINWANGIELALRQISWLLALRFINGSKSLTAEMENKIANNMYLQTSHIARNLSFYSSANNHLISELAGMTLMGKCLGQNDWVDKAASLLEEEVDRQILMDGAGAEQSPSYLSHTIEYYLLFALAVGNAISPKILRGLERGSLFLQSLLNAGDNAICSGDSDSGEVLRLSNGYSNIKTLLNIASCVTGNADILQADVREDEKCFWLLGPTRFQELTGSAGKRGVCGRLAFEESGNYILENTLNDRHITVTFDCGPLGMKPMAAHGHADALSFILHVDNDPVFIDPGTYIYFIRNRWRDYFRGTSAHNTVRIDGADQSEFGGAFMAIRHAEAECTGWTEGEQVSGKHTGYGFLRSPAVHSRAITFEIDNKALSIMDRIESPREHLVEQFFHLGGECIPEIIDRGTVSICLAGGNIIVRVEPRMELSIYYGNDVLPLGWLSRVYGSKEKTFTIVGRNRMRGSGEFATRICF